MQGLIISRDDAVPELTQLGLAQQIGLPQKSSFRGIQVRSS